MASKFSEKVRESRAIEYILIAFWFFFWILKVIGKFMPGPSFLWNGENYREEFATAFGNIGVENTTVIYGSLILITILEVVAFFMIALALWNLLSKHDHNAWEFFLRGSCIGLVIFGIFTMGDQVFGNEALLEHTSYWLIQLVSLLAYRYLSQPLVRLKGN